MGICVCCGRRGAYYGCDCRPGWCNGCGFCVGHCRCHHEATGRVEVPSPVFDLDDPSGPFAGLGEAGESELPATSAVEVVGANADGNAWAGAEVRTDVLASLALAGRADDLLARLDRVTPADGDEMCSLFLERGWVEAVRHLARGVMLTLGGIKEAGLLIAASNEWADGLATDDTGSLAG